MLPHSSSETCAAPLAAPRVAGSIVDLFCGVGGLAHGFRLEGFDIAAGYDVDETCRYAFETNNRAPFVRCDVEELAADEIVSTFYRGEPRILVGCAPCQPFSSYNQKNDDPKWRLVTRFAELIAAARPDVVSMENVPRLLDFQGGAVFSSFVARLQGAGYHVWWRVVPLTEYGLPQRRERLVLLASLHAPLRLETAETLGLRVDATVNEAIGHLPSLCAGEADPHDRLHAASQMSELNLQRIRASRPGGTWHEWEDGLVADCHRSSTGRGYGAVYGRMRGDRPAPTITTQFFGFGSGRFGHPTQDRALSIREGAILQSFPPDYRFLAPGEPMQMKRLGRVIGNAVPVVLGRAIARSIAVHLGERVAS